MPQVRTEGPAGARIMLVGEAPGADEAMTGHNFVGHAGRILDALLKQTPIVREQCLVTNVCRDQPPGNRIEFFYEDSKCTRPKPIMQKYIEMLKHDIGTFRPNIVVGLGRTALYALTGQTSISAFRGYVMESTLVPGVKTLSTYHPIKVDHEWKLNFPAIMDLRKAFANSETPDLPVDRRVLQSSPSKREFIQFCQHLALEQREPVALDIETKSPGSHIDIVGIADSPYHAMSFNFFNGREPRFSAQEEMEVWYWIAQVCKTCPVIAHNGTYDLAVLWHNNHILVENFHADTLVAGHVAWPESPRSLGFLASICLNVPAWKHTQASLPTLYNAGDAANTYGIWNVLRAEMERQEVLHTFRFEMRQTYPAMMMQLQGVPVNKERQQEMLHSTEQDDEGKPKGILPRLQVLEKEIEQSLGKKVSLRSPAQMKTVLYTDLGLPEQYKRRKTQFEAKKVTTDAEALKKLSRMSDNPVLGKIMEWKKLDKLKQFVDTTISPAGRIHTCYNITGATMQREAKGLVVDDEDQYKSFGRWSSSASIILPYGPGNNQNIPKKARKIYDWPGKKIVSPDYMQAEAVVVAYLIGDMRLIKMFEDSFGKTRAYRKEHNLDVHKFTAHQMFGIPIDKVTPDQRQIGKTIRHANNYSAGPGVLAAKLGIPMAEAKKLMGIYHQTCPQLRLWHGRIQEQLRRTRTLTNLLGRKHKFTERWGDTLFRSAYSYIPQSTVGDLMNRAIAGGLEEYVVDVPCIYYDYPDILHMWAQLHDATYFYCDEDEIPMVMKTARKCMLIPLTVNGMTFQIDVDFSVGDSWGSVEEVEYYDYVTDEEAA